MKRPKRLHNRYATSITKVLVFSVISSRKLFLVMDQKRSNIGQFYSPEAILVYEGHRIKGQSQISDFYQKNPPSSHRVTSLDSQPIDKSMTEGAKSILINGSFHFYKYSVASNQDLPLYLASGTIRFGVDKPHISHKTFTQHFVLSMVNEKWLVVSDTVRLSVSEQRPR